MKTVLFVVFALCLLLPLIASFFELSRATQRRFYWSCACAATVPAFFMAYPNWKEGLGAALFALIVMTVIAYGYTPYIKLRGKIYALTVQDSQPDSEETPLSTKADSEFDPAPDAYSGLLTARKVWWMLVILSVIATINLCAFIESTGKGWVAVGGASFLTFLAIGSGLGDASWGYPIARGQYVQFVVVSVITVGTFTVVYLGAYFVAKSRPIRRKHSMEYRAHPRHQKRYR